MSPVDLGGDATKTELDIFLALIEDWFNVTAIAKNKSKDELAKFIEWAYKKLASGGLVFGEQNMPTAIVERRKAAIKVHKTGSALMVKTEYATRGLYQATMATRHTC